MLAYQILCGHLKDGILMACDGVCGRKSCKRSKGDNWGWNEEVNEAISRMKNAYSDVLK